MTSVYQSGTVIRRRLVDPDCPMDYGVLPELREQGITDYLIVPLVFTDGAIHAASWSTQAPEGFCDAHVAAIEAISNPFARVAEIRALRRTAVNLLDAYVGKRSGARILAGHIRRVERTGLNVSGAAVNRTARIETVTKEVGVPLLLSQDFADALGLACRPVGTFELKGVPEPQAVYALDDAPVTRSPDPPAAAAPAGSSGRGPWRS